MVARGVRMVVLVCLMSATIPPAGCNKPKPPADDPPDAPAGPAPNVPAGSKKGSKAVAPAPTEVGWTGAADELQKEFVYMTPEFTKATAGKWIVVSGTVRGYTFPLEQSKTRSVSLVVVRGEPVTCHFPIAAAPAGRFSIGQTVKVRGVLDQRPAALNCTEGLRTGRGWGEPGGAGHR